MTDQSPGTQMKAYAAGGAFTLIFCLHYLAAGKLLEDLPPVVFGASRGIGAGLLLTVVFFRKLKPLLTPRNAGRAVLVGLFGFCLNQLLLLEGLKRSTPADAALINNFIPLVSTGMAFIFRRERLVRRQTAGLLLGIGSLTAYLVWQRHADLGDHVTGNLLILANVVSFSVALILIKGLVESVNEVAVTTAMLTVGGIVLGSVAGNDLVRHLQPLLTDAAKVGLLVFEVFVVTIGGYFLNVYALKRLPVAATTSLGYLQPPLTAALALILLGREVDPAMGLLFPCVVTASWLARPGRHQ